MLADFPERYEGKIFFLTSPNAPLGFAFPLSYIEEIAHSLRRDAGGRRGLRRLRRRDGPGAGEELRERRRHPHLLQELRPRRDAPRACRRPPRGDRRPRQDPRPLPPRPPGPGCGRRRPCATSPTSPGRWRRIRETRAWFTSGLRAIGYRVIDSQTNFVFASPPDGDGKRVYDALFERKILVRHFSDPLLAHGMRITVGTREEMERTLAAIKEIG